MNGRRLWVGPFDDLLEARKLRDSSHLIVVDFLDRIFVVPTERVEEFVDFARQRALNDGVDLRTASLWVR